MYVNTTVMVYAYNVCFSTLQKYTNYIRNVNGALICCTHYSIHIYIPLFLLSLLRLLLHYSLNTVYHICCICLLASYRYHTYIHTYIHTYPVNPLSLLSMVLYIAWTLCGMGEECVRAAIRTGCSVTETVTGHCALFTGRYCRAAQ